MLCGSFSLLGYIWDRELRRHHCLTNGEPGVSRRGLIFLSERLHNGRDLQPLISDERIPCGVPIVFGTASGSDLPLVFLLCYCDIFHDGAGCSSTDNVYRYES